MQTNVKPPSPLLAPKQRPLKPPSPLQPKNAPKTPISHPQRRWRFQLRLGLREQRRRRFQTTARTSGQRRCRFHARDFRCPRAMARPNQRTFACNSTTDTSRVSMQSLKFQTFYGAIDDRRPGIACEIAKQYPQAPPAWRVPEGPEGLAAPAAGGGGAWQGF